MKRIATLSLLWGVLMLGTTSELAAQNQKEANYDEAKVPVYELPDPLTFVDGTTVSKESWPKRREEILQLFKEHVYGTMPPAPPKNSRPNAEVLKSTVVELAVEPESENEETLTVKARLKEVKLHFSNDKKGPAATLLMVLPLKPKGKCPVFVGYNFRGNQTVDSCPEISLSHVWQKNKTSKQSDEATRGKSSSRWPLGLIVSRGFGLVTLYYGDVDPDFHDEFKNGVHALYPALQDRPDNWTSIGGWAWGLHRVMDYFEVDADVDQSRVVLLGHSRLGKTSLWTGATDPRFSIVISNNSGCGGAALARRQFGETVKRINKVFPHWFCTKHKEYGDDVSALPVDQHMLVALMAPRPVYVASAVEDRWADPNGEFLSALHAGPVFELLGKSGVGVGKQPPLNQSVGGHVGYHVREGKHDVKRFDWIQYLNFAGRHFSE